MDPISVRLPEALLTWLDEEVEARTEHGVWSERPSRSTVLREMVICNMEERQWRSQRVRGSG